MDVYGIHPSLLFLVPSEVADWKDVPRWIWCWNQCIEQCWLDGSLLGRLEQCLDTVYRMPYIMRLYAYVMIWCKCIVAVYRPYSLYMYLKYSKYSYTMYVSNSCVYNMQILCIWYSYTIYNIRYRNTIYICTLQICIEHCCFSLKNSTKWSQGMFICLLGHLLRYFGQKLVSWCAL